MRLRDVREFLLQPGLILGLILVGILLLSAVLYYRATKIQRFIEPALALSQPRNEFAQSINKLIVREFSKKAEIKFMMGSILIEERLIFTENNKIKDSAYETLKKLSNVFISALDDERTRSYISDILVITHFPISSDRESNNKMRSQQQYKAEIVLNFIYTAAPKLEKGYGTYFAATAVPVAAPKSETGWIMFRIIPSEFMHIEVLQRLHKYVR